MGWPAVRGFTDRTDKVTAEVLNLPLNQLSERTEYLRRMVSARDNTRVAIIGASVSNKGYGYPALGQVVYRLPPLDDKDLSTYALASAFAEQDAWFYASEQAMAVGVVGSTPTTEHKADIVLYGLIDFGRDGIPASDVISDAEPTSGRHYLSYTTGKLTANPAGPVVYVCDCQVFYEKRSGKTPGYRVRSMLVNPQYRDTGESHIHRSFVISGNPLGGYSVRTSDRYHAAGIVDTSAAKSTTAMPSGITLHTCGAWTKDSVGDITYTIGFSDSGSGSGWARYKLNWSSGGKDGSSSVTATVDGPIAIGTHGLKIRIQANGNAPSSAVGKTWEIKMPDAARAWINYTDTSVSPNVKGFKLDLGMYPAMARYVPLIPDSCGALTVDGLERNGPVFGSSAKWKIVAKDDNGDAGPWLIWVGGEYDGSDSLTAPFVWKSTVESQYGRDIVLHANRMRVGPDGFVTSLQPAKGAPFRITSVQTDSDDTKGALQIDMDIDFTTSESDVAGHQVVKAIEGSRFKTGPVVERIKVGAGLDMLPTNGQGTVTIWASNAVYAGDFETIALKNAKQDLSGVVFPYTKLLSWDKTGVANVASGFAAKFRVPDHIPYKQYKVIVSASVFGESAAASTSVATFSMQNYVLADHACSEDANPEASVVLDGSVAAPTPGQLASIGVTFDGPYTAFDPVLIHGFNGRTDSAHRKTVDDLLLKTSEGTPVLVYPGYFVGLDISRVSSTGTRYADPIGFLSLRWNLVEA